MKSKKGTPEKKSGSSDSPSGADLFEIVQQVVDLVCGRAELADDLAIVGILLALERAARLVDVPQALGDLLSLGIGDSKHAMSGRQLAFVESPPSWITIPMSFPAGLGHCT